MSENKPLEDSVNVSEQNDSKQNHSGHEQDETESKNETEKRFFSRAKYDLREKCEFAKLIVKLKEEYDQSAKRRWDQKRKMFVTSTTSATQQKLFVNIFTT